MLGTRAIDQGPPECFGRASECAIQIRLTASIILDLIQATSLTWLQNSTLGVRCCSDITEEGNTDSLLTSLHGEAMLGTRAIDQGPPECFGRASECAIQIRLTASIILDLIQAASLTWLQNSTLGVCFCGDVTEEWDRDGVLTGLYCKAMFSTGAINQASPKRFGRASVRAIQIRLATSITLNFIQAACSRWTQNSSLGVRRCCDVTQEWNADGIFSNFDCEAVFSTSSIVQCPTK